MTLYRPTELRLFLDQLGTRAKKQLGQNFLIDGNILRKIVSTADIKPGDLVIEIGPGPGALTQALLQTGARVIAIEKDPLLAAALSRLQTSDQRLEIICADVLKITTFPANAKVVANLPYNIATPILTRLLQLPLQSLTLMVQKEVADRFVAAKDTSEYSSLTLFIQAHATCQYCFTVEPTCFYPPPKVRSAVTHFTLHPSSHDPALFTLIRTAFQQRRKMLRSSLKEKYPHISEVLEELGLNPQARPENLSLVDFVNLFQMLSKQL